MKLALVNSTTLFQHTAARRRLVVAFGMQAKRLLFQHTAARRRLAGRKIPNLCCLSFNTQPPEGGWCDYFQRAIHCWCFNTQPPEGGWSDAFYWKTD